MRNYKYALYSGGLIVSGSQAYSKGKAIKYGSEILERNGLSKLIQSAYVKPIR